MNANILSNPLDSRSQSPPAALTHELVIGGITPFTTIDFPGRLAAVLYTQGCAWRCRYCHNTHMQPLGSEAVIPFEKVRHFLEARRGFLDGVVFCGGEPTLQPGLAGAMRAVKNMGFQAALHTAGMVPGRLSAVLSLCDWVGFDVKAPFERYEKITGVPGSGENARESLDRLLMSGIDHEVRTTFHPALLSEEEVLEMAKGLRAMGVRRYALQAFRPDGCHDAALLSVPLSSGSISEGLRTGLHSLFESFELRSQT